MDNPRTGKVCQKTIGPEYPHHWKCKYVETGHPGCNCEGKNSCEASHCIINLAPNPPDWRFPDGSICVKGEIKKGCVVVRPHSITGTHSIVQVKLGTDSNA